MRQNQNWHFGDQFFNKCNNQVKRKYFCKKFGSYPWIWVKKLWNQSFWCQNSTWCELVSQILTSLSCINFSVIVIPWPTTKSQQFDVCPPALDLNLMVEWLKVVNFHIQVHLHVSEIIIKKLMIYLLSYWVYLVCYI